VRDRFALVLFCGVLGACSRSVPPAAHAEDEVLANLRAQPCAGGTVADLELPEPYLRRVADRVLRASYVERFHVIIADGQPAPPAPALPQGSPPPIVQHVHAQPSTRVDRDPAPGEFVRKRLARDGLLPTTAALIRDLRQRSKPTDLAALEACGIPVDWLSHFSPPDQDARSVVEWIAAGASDADLARAKFAFRPSAPGFHLASESGECALESLRVQLTRGDDWDRPGDGGSVDLVRQLVEKLPGVPIVASLEAAKLPIFLRTAGTWRWDSDRRFDLLLEPWPLAQWAQDNAKTGRDAAGALVLLPRYASRGELVANFVPGETLAPEGLTLLGQRVVSSPLLFQGGNLYCCTNPKNGERLLLLGEAELHRNTSLGLTREQVLAAFRGEFGVDRCVVLPAVSFHIDVELSIRAVGSELVAFVNDQATAAQMIVGCGLAALRERGLLPDAEFERIRERLAKKQLSEALALLAPVLAHGSHGPGTFSESLARAFQADSADSGAGNLLRFLSAIDYVAGISGSGQPLGLDPGTAGYLRSFLRRERERYTFVHGLEELGMRIVPLPGWPEDAQGITPLNGIHERGRYLFPTYGGLYAPLDDACAGILARTLGPEVQIVRIGCAESQRRAGAVRCSISPIFGP